MTPDPGSGASPEAFTAQAAPVFAGHPGLLVPVSSGTISRWGCSCISCCRRPRSYRVISCLSHFGRFALIGDPRAIRPFVICVSFYMCIRGAAEVRLSHLSNRARHLRPATLPATLPRGCPGPAQSVPPVPRRTPQTAPACRCLCRNPTAGAPEACHRAPSGPRSGVVAVPGSKGRPAAAAAHKPLSISRLK